MERPDEKANMENGTKLLQDSKETNPAMSKDMEVRIHSSYRRTWWQRRTFLEKSLFVLLILSFIVTIVMVIIAATHGHMLNCRNGISSSESQDVCLTETCIKAASNMLGAVNFEADPCEDFFEFACGTWNKKHIIPDDRPNYNTFRKLGDELHVTLKGLLESPVQENEVKATVNAKNLYQSCLDMEIIEQRAEKPLVELIESLGGWPVLSPNWDESSFDATDLMAKLRLYNNRVLINQWVSSDDKNSDVNIIQIDQAPLGMPGRDYYLKGRDDGTLMAYENFAVDVAKMLNADPARAEQEMREMVDFEIALATLTMPEEKRRDTAAIYNKMKVKDLTSNLTDALDWQRYFQIIFANVSVEIFEDDDIVVYAPDFIQEMGTLLKQTPKRVLGNYMIWMTIYHTINNGQPYPPQFLALLQKYSKALYGTDRDKSRWRICVNYVNENFGMAVGRMFVKHSFDERAKANAMEMIGSIQKAFAELLNEVPWMDEDTKNVAREKAHSIQEKIGYPDYIMNDTALNLDYEGIDMSPVHYFENVLNNLNTATRSNLRCLREPVDRSKWSTAPAVVNAFYSATRNQIMFPAGILQPPFYHESYPKSMNFGGIAMVIGHELTHGFDDKGRQFDKDGNLKEWWSDSVIEKFKEQAQCIIDQYSNYTVPEVSMNLNGRQTQGENIADNGGLKQAFKAYRTWVSEQGHEEPPMPGIKLNHNQIFFLNFAQIWCGTSRPESYIQAIRSGRHSPGRFRVIGSLSNSYDFAEAYNCPAGSKMNPLKKCSVW